MLEYLQSLDAQCLLAINGMHNAYLDTFMSMISQRYAWALILLTAIVVNSRKGWKPLLIFALAVGVAILIADQVASGMIKPAVERLRPSHEPSLEGLVHLIDGQRYGLYGFVSSHASNAFAVAVLVGGIMPRKSVLWSLLAWACLQCYSRMYMGVHYPGDIIGGTIVGLLAGLVAYRLWKWGVVRYCGSDCTYTERDSLAMVAAVWLTVLADAVVACF